MSAICSGEDGSGEDGFDEDGSDDSFITQSVPGVCTGVTLQPNTRTRKTGSRSAKQEMCGNRCAMGFSTHD
jgi:hypothetical protein